MTNITTVRGLRAKEIEKLINTPEDKQHGFYKNVRIKKEKQLFEYKSKNIKRFEIIFDTEQKAWVDINANARYEKKEEVMQYYTVRATTQFISDRLNIMENQIVLLGITSRWFKFKLFKFGCEQNNIEFNDEEDYYDECEKADKKEDAKDNGAGRAQSYKKGEDGHTILRGSCLVVNVEIAIYMGHYKELDDDDDDEERINKFFLNNL